MTQSSAPSALAAIERDTQAIGFTMASDPLTGSLLRTLAASRPGGALLELGTGTGLATAWLLDGMDTTSTLLSVDNNDAVVAVARHHLGTDDRVTFLVGDGIEALRMLHAERRRFDLIFADAVPGKYDALNEALDLLRPGGIYVIDDMLPQPNWPADHPPKASALAQTLASRQDLRIASLEWSTGIILASKAE